MKKRELKQWEKDYFREHFYSSTVAEVCRTLNFSVATYYRLAAELGLSLGKEPRNKISWTPEMLETLCEKFPTALNKDLCLELGVSETSMHRKARELKLTKSSEFSDLNGKEISSRISKGLHASLAPGKKLGRFRKGDHAFPEGEFQPGRNPHDQETPEQKAARLRKMRKTRRETTYKELIAIKYGFGRHTKQHLKPRTYIPAPFDDEAWKALRKKEMRVYNQRWLLRKKGYKVEGNIAYYNDNTNRSVRYESRSAKNPFTFLPEKKKRP